MFSRLLNSPVTLLSEYPQCQEKKICYLKKNTIYYSVNATEKISVNKRVSLNSKLASLSPPH